MHYFGADIGYYDDLITAQNEITKYGGNIIQIFILNNKKYNKIYDTKLKIKTVVHASYLNNLCKPWDKYSWWIKNLENEILKASQLNSIGIVLHFGKQMDLKIEEAYNNMYSALLYIHTKTIEHKNIIIMLETPANSFCSNFDELVNFYNKIKNCNNKDFKKRIKLCVDTCHIYAAGYDITSIKKINDYFSMFENKIGLKYIKLIHLNDSKGICGSKLDRHMGIGQGYIGYENLLYIYRLFKNKNVPIILETPNINYRTEINNFLNK